jgi:23S rRNA (uracil1939-C5)-methyltransferase
MQEKTTAPFKIASIDSLGQGVSKEDKILFIPKTLPGEEGSAQILAQKKRVFFGWPLEISKKAANRITPECPHFSECPSCHFLHTDYESEMEYKRLSFEQIFKNLPLPRPDVITAPRRLGYRNRIQLHYDTKKRQLGLLSLSLKKIIEIPSCKISVKEISQTVTELYSNQHWLKLAPQDQPQGHVELYFRDGKVHLNWNRPYAEGGFTQVFEEMNIILKDRIQEIFKGESLGNLLDLFGGGGNLSEKLNYTQRRCVDFYGVPKGKDFISQDLYAPKSLEIIQKKLQLENLNVKTLILDPPRAGFKELALWLDTLKPETVLYVSCDPHTLARDLRTVSAYDVSKSFLLDFFPSTFHFETMLLLRRK